MKQLKSIFVGLTIGGFALFMFFIGLGLMVVMIIALTISRLFMKPQSHVELKNKWQARRDAMQNKVKTAKGNIIDGQYDVIDPR